MRRPANSDSMHSMASTNNISRCLAKPGLMGWAITVAVCLAAVMAAFAFFLTDWVPVVQASVTTLAVLFAGAWAVWRVLSFRELHGFLVVTQSVSHARIADGATHLQVIATLRNQSRVSMRPDEGFCYIEGILIGVTGALAHAAASASDGNPMTYVDSRIVSSVAELEPGEETQYQFDFLLSEEYKYIRSHVYIKDPTKRSDDMWGTGWESTEIHILEVAEHMGTEEIIRVKAQDGQKPKVTPPENPTGDKPGADAKKEEHKEG